MSTTPLETLEWALKTNRFASIKPDISKLADVLRNDPNAAKTNIKIIRTVKRLQEYTQD